MINAGLMLEQAGDLEGAQAMHRRAVEGWTRAQGPEHSGTLLALGNLSGVEIDRGNLDEGIATYRSVPGVRERVLGPLHPDTVRARINLG